MSASSDSNNTLERTGICVVVLASVCTPPAQRGRWIMKQSAPPIPDNRGKRRWIVNIRGERVEWMIEDEITRVQSTAPHKVICFQKMRRPDNGATEFRVGYYMIGVRPRMKGRWVWGQYALLISEQDLRALLREAENRKWI